MHGSVRKGVAAVGMVANQSEILTNIIIPRQGGTDKLLEVGCIGPAIESE
jgi:hypothetical protein